MKITAGMVASELRKMADGLDKEPDAVVTKPLVMFYADDKTEFINLARMMPRPLRKSVDTLASPRLQLRYFSAAMELIASVPQSLACKLLTPARPAVYECQALLSAAEEAQLEAANG